MEKEGGGARGEEAGLMGEVASHVEGTGVGVGE